jgi:hypothetical protein
MFLTYSHVNGWGMYYVMSYLAARRAWAGMSSRRALEMAANNMEAMLGHGGRWQSYNLMSFESPFGARREAAHVGGGSQPEERHGLAAEVLKIDRHITVLLGSFWREFGGVGAVFNA